jgi:hypothetical protein
LCLEFLPTFANTSSSELDNVLATIRDKILVIKHLNKTQLKLIGNPEQKSYLETENVTVSIGDTEARLAPFIIKKDAPPRRATFEHALRLSEETGEWDFWIDIFRGVSSADLEIQKSFVKKFVWKALHCGQLDLVYKLVSKPWTPISLDDEYIRVTLIKSIRQAAFSEDEKGLKSRLLQAEHLNELARRDIHGQHAAGFPDPLMTLVPLDICAKLITVENPNQTKEVEQDLNSEVVSAPVRDYVADVEAYAKKLKTVDLVRLFTCSYSPNVL